MLLSGVLFVLFLTGCWLYCLTDAALTPAYEYRGRPKAVWIAFIIMTFIVGAAAWMVARRVSRRRHWPPAAIGYVSDGKVIWYPYRPTAGIDRAVVARHPAGRSLRPVSPGRNVPKGPDDDPEFLAQLSRRIHGTPKDPTE